MSAETYRFTIDGIEVEASKGQSVIEACDVFLSPHSGLGFVALCVDTPWVTIAGGRWPEYFYNKVPFRSVLPDPRRFPCYSDETAGQGTGVRDLDGEDRTSSMGIARLQADLERIVEAVVELLAGDVTYDVAMADHARNLADFWSSRPPGEDPYLGQLPRIWSIDNDLDPYLE